MRLVLDSGNSSVKYGVFKNHTLLFNGSIKQNESLKSHLPLEILNQITIIASCSVSQNIKTILLPDVPHVLISSESKFPFSINYKTKDTLGIDRLVACVGAHESNCSTLVIDCGTCVTTDFVSSDNSYQGGSISPGIDLRFKSMHNFTDQLPFISSFKKNNKVIGDSTESCMKSGVINGLRYELQGFINEYQQKFPTVKTFLTGGDSIFFEDAFKNSIFADQNLVLKGLDLLIDLNEI